ncbi:MAG: acetyl-CoA carboxylase carboxyltransferase subunit beta, partial [Planctomycetes bacterium]|nr:acetyl-CoA carboxylase carboxyltransferase subunit beta [Planctomycetota bacterium]
LRFGRKRDLPDGLWLKCPGCGQMVFKKQVEERLQVCPECNYHFRISAPERIRITLDEGSFHELYADLEPIDYLEFVDRKPYSQRITEQQAKTGLKDACMIGTGAIEGHDIIFGATDSRFLMGSMGAVVGEKIPLAAEEAAKRRVPLVLVSGSGGGARMMEGIISLAQMAKTAAAIARLDSAGIPFLSVLTNPTMGGVAASWAALGDILIAEPQALIGFAGPRTIKLTLGIDLPEGFQSSEFLLEHGFVDMIVNRVDMKRDLGKLLGLVTAGLRE